MLFAKARGAIEVILLLPSELRVVWCERFVLHAHSSAKSGDLKSAQHSQGERQSEEARDANRERHQDH
jgi:hypothetical protein